ncbi:hypothetical protein KA005_03355 [bacterium]|nr:hypothetical protein [bacterium]
MNDSMNPYVDHDGNAVLRPSVVAFIDILGYSDQIDRCGSFDEEKELFGRLYYALSKWKHHLDPSQSQKKLDESNFDKNTGKSVLWFRAFTDNIVVGYPITSIDKIELEDIFRRLSFFQLLMAAEGFFFRGAISIGALYMDDIMVFGNGLVEAYKAEAKLARDPRIILTDSVLEVVKAQLNNDVNRLEIPHTMSLLRDADGQIFLNYLDKIFMKMGTWPDGIEKHKKNVETNLAYYKSQPMIWNKYMWVARYHNYYCNANLKDWKTSFSIDIDEYQIDPVLLKQT